MMDPLIKKKWLEALRSGHFEKIRHNYGQNEYRCALGVLQAVCDEDYSAELFLFDSDGRDRSKSTWQVITEANDERGWSFEEIADWIEVFVD